MTAARLGYGTKLKLGDNGSPETFAEIAEIVDGPNDEDSVELVEVTNHQSAGSRKEYIGGLIDGGEVTFTCNYIPTNATHNRTTGLQALLRQTRNFRLEEPGNPTGYQFAAVIMNVGKQYPVGAAMQFAVTIKKSGDLTPYTIS
jgi:hypothetical protein